MRRTKVVCIVLSMLILMTMTIALSSCNKLPALKPSETERPETNERESRMMAYKIEEADGGILVNLSCDLGDIDPLKAQIDCLLTESYYGIISEKTFPAPTEPTDIILDCPPEKSGGEITAEIKLSDGKKVYCNMTLRISYGLPQLTRDGVKCVLSALTTEEKAALVTGHSPVKDGASGGTYGLWKYGVPSVTVNDGPAGIRYSHGIWYPSVMNLTSSWDSELITTIGKAIGEDTLAHGIDIILGPGMNIQKNVLGGRNFEYCSEDPLLTGLTSAAYVKGVQESGAGACLKHYAANDQETNRGSVSAVVTERALREIYLRPFRIAVEKSAPVSVMSSYNCVNGTHASVSRELLTEILRGEFGFRGVVMSDWGAAGDVADKVKAGNDLNMPGSESDAERILAALERGTLSMEELDASCENILRAVSLSATANGISMNFGVDYDGHSVLSAEAAADTMVLLKNEGGALPLKKGSEVAVFGNGSFNTIYGGDGSGAVYPKNTVNIIDGINNHKNLSVFDFYGNPFYYCEKHSADAPDKDVKVSTEYAEFSAEGADAAVIVISRSTCEGADNKVRKGDYLLSDNEAEMIDNVAAAFHAAGKKVTVLLNVGDPIDVASWRDKVDAIIMIGYPGEGAGTAVASVLSGETNPSGKLTMTWPLRYADTPANRYFPGNSGSVIYYEDIYVGYRYYGTFGVDVAYPFGYGLSYTSFEYSGFKLTETDKGNYYAEVTVKNTGKVSGREVVEFYVSKPETTMEQPAYELCAYAKTSVMKPGQYQTVKVYIPASEIASYDTQNSRYIADSGEYKFYVGSSAGTFFGELTSNRENITVIAEAENRCAPKKEFDYIRKQEYVVPEVSEGRVNIASGRNGKSSGDESKTLAASNAFDGDDSTRWSPSEKTSGTVYLTVDLETAYEIGLIRIKFESASVPVEILVSETGNKFKSLGLQNGSGSQVSEFNLGGIKARLIKLLFKADQSVSICEFEVFEATGEEKTADNALRVKNNIAAGAKAKACSVEGNYSPGNAIDGNISTRWSSLQTGESWLVIDLKEEKQISGIAASLEAAWAPYRIEYSTDGSSYTVINSYDAGEVFVSEDKLNITARYIRFIREDENWFSIWEVQIYSAE
ncbi:MAG: glycoside hydrolase family 3 C-terminal domain-containing protein [Clostridia bacterium]|nr:glycoside hydrolase family 3 C-terminal domain-containing protein [Clostridia bacterium]